MPGKIKPEKRPLPLKTRQTLNTKGFILNAMLPVTPGNLASMRFPGIVRRKYDAKPNTMKKFEASRKSLKSPVKKAR